MNAYLLSSIFLFGSVLFTLPLAAEEEDLSAPPEQRGEVISAEEEAELIQVDPAIEIAEFEEPQSGGMGIGSASQLELPADLWQNIAEKDVLSLLAMLPEQVKSPAIRNLLQRSLVVETARSDFSEAVLMGRVNALLKMGQASLALQLLKTVPDGLSSEAIEKQRYLLRVMAGEPREELCKMADEKQTNQPEAFWQRFQVLCQALQEETAKAQLGLELLREQNNAPEVFDAVVQSLLHKKKEPATADEWAREALGWAMMADTLPKITEKTSVETLGLVALNANHKGEWRKQVEALGLNVENLKAPQDSSPDVPLAYLRLKEEAGATETRRALIALAMRRAWDKPVSVETEDDLLMRHYRGQATELSLIWRESTVQMQDKEQRLAALWMLIRPLTESLTHYTVSDLHFAVEELKALGFPVDATAIAEEALSGE